MGLLNLFGMPHIIRRMMPIAVSCPILPVRSEILLGLLLVACLVVEVIAPVAVQIVAMALFVPLAVRLSLPDDLLNLRRIYPANVR